MKASRLDCAYRIPLLSRWQYTPSTGSAPRANRLGIPKFASTDADVVALQETKGLNPRRRLKNITAKPRG